MLEERNECGDVQTLVRSTLQRAAFNRRGGLSDVLEPFTLGVTVDRKGESARHSRRAGAGFPNGGI